MNVALLILTRRKIKRSVRREISPAVAVEVLLTRGSPIGREVIHLK